MESILNRWRGTGNIFSIFSGSSIYAIYLCLLFGYITEWYIGLFVAIGFLIGESFAWGKWVGALISNDKIDLEKEYQDKEGYNFPYIHKLTEFFIDEKDNFLNYCRLALFFRGLIWGLILYLPLIVFNYISIFDYTLVSLVYGLGFPFACYLSTLKSFNYSNKFISIIGRWESQEIYYGIIHFICNLYLIGVIIGL